MSLTEKIAQLEYDRGWSMPGQRGRIARELIQVVAESLGVSVDVLESLRLSEEWRVVWRSYESIPLGSREEAQSHKASMGGGVKGGGTIQRRVRGQWEDAS